MIYFTIAFLCNAGLFLVLLEDRYRFWTNVSVTIGVYLISLLGSAVFQNLIEGVWGEYLSLIFHGALLFFSSLFLYTNNFLQKLYLSLLCIGNCLFLSFFCELFFGLLPISASGAFAAFFSVLSTLLFSLLICLCLYRPIHHFSDRGVSGFLIGMTLFQIFGFLLFTGSFDIFFRGHVLAGRFLFAVLFYLATFFAFRSLYHAAKFRERTMMEAARKRILEMESGDFTDILASIKEVRSVQKSSEYALDTVKIMLRDGDGEKILSYIDNFKKSAAASPILGEYHKNPYINAIIATKAAVASQTGVQFECSAASEEIPLETGEICIVVNELLTGACLEAAKAKGEKKIHFSLLPADDSVLFEVIYSFSAAAEEKFSLKGKKFKDLLQHFLEDSPAESAVKSFENTEDIVGRHSGKVSVSDSGGMRTVTAAIPYRY